MNPNESHEDGGKPPREVGSQRSISDQVISLVYSESYRPSKPRSLHKQLELPADQYPALRRTIKSLVQAGKVVFASNHLVLRPGQQSPRIHPPKAERTEDETTSEGSVRETKKSKGSRKNSVTGLFRATQHGYGFVQLTSETGEVLPDDVFIPAKSTKTAMDGDVVELYILRSSADGRREGQIIEVVSRARREFVGTYRYQNGQSVVWLDGVPSENPVLIGDVRGLPINNDDKVIVEMVKYPDAFSPGEAVLLRVLGTSSNPAIDTISVIYQFGLTEEFPEPVLEYARQLADRFNGLSELSTDVNDPQSIFYKRRDLTAIPTITIDPFDARDFDDAISLSRNDKGNWELLVHIADVSYFVPEGSVLDEEARSRATSVYLPDKVIPMLPEIISNHLASLQPEKLRLSKTVSMEISSEGTVLHTEIFNSVIRNAYRFNYEQIDQYLVDQTPWKEKLPPVIFDLVRDMHTLAMMLRKRRMRGGSIELMLPEVKIDLDKIGKVKGAHLVHHTESHQMIEEFMLSANQAVATYLDDREIPFLRRAHAPPQRVKLRRLFEFVTGLGIQCGDLQDRFEIQRIVDLVRGQPLEQSVNFAILKSMSKAAYQPAPERHYALDMTHYCHFTSPIRRYPDLVVHRIIQKIIDAENPMVPLSVLGFLGQHCSDREVNAENAERELTRIKLLHFMSKRVGQEFAGTISSVKADGVDVRLKEIPVDGFVSIDELPPDRYRYDRQIHTLEGFRNGNRFRLGDTLLIKIKRVDIARRALFLELVTKTQSVAPIESSRTSERSYPRSFKQPRADRDSLGLKQFDRRSNSKSSRRKQDVALEDPSSLFPKRSSPKKKKSRPGKKERAARKRRSDS
jgi:ribonuclease R